MQERIRLRLRIGCEQIFDLHRRQRAQARRRERIGLVQINEPTEPVVVDVRVLVVQIEDVGDEPLSAVVARVRDQGGAATITGQCSDVYRFAGRQLRERAVVLDLAAAPVRSCLPREVSESIVRIGAERDG